MATLLYAGLGDLRVCVDLPGGAYDDTTVSRPCWYVFAKAGDADSIADVFEAEPRVFEMWSQGDMVEVDGPEHARQCVEAALTVEAFARSLVEG